MQPYREFVADFLKAIDKGAELPLGGFPPCEQPVPSEDAPTALLFSAHPDDECITGGLPLRLLREAGWRVVNVAVTQGSKRERQAGRLLELKAACDFLGFETVQTAENGLEKVNPAGRESDPPGWREKVDIIAGLLVEHRPEVIFVHHADDANSTHRGVYLLVLDALAGLKGFSCHVVQTEYWAPIAKPNLMVESAPKDVADLVAAVSFHVGEVERNPYHVGLPSWMHDNVRRGSELVGGQGGAAAGFQFATLYHLAQWRDGALQTCLPDGRQIACRDDVAGLFA